MDAKVHCPLNAEISISKNQRPSATSVSLLSLPLHSEKLHQVLQYPIIFVPPTQYTLEDEAKMSATGRSRRSSSSLSEIISEHGENVALPTEASRLVIHQLTTSPGSCRLWGLGTWIYPTSDRLRLPKPSRSSRAVLHEQRPSSSFAYPKICELGRSPCPGQLRGGRILCCMRPWSDLSGILDEHEKSNRSGEQKTGLCRYNIKGSMQLRNRGKETS